MVTFLVNHKKNWSVKYAEYFTYVSMPDLSANSGRCPNITFIK